MYENVLASLTSEIEEAYHLFECLACARGTMSVQDLRYAVCLEADTQYRSSETLRLSPQYCSSDEVFVRRAERLSRGFVRMAVVSIEREVMVQATKTTAESERFPLDEGIPKLGLTMPSSAVEVLRTMAKDHKILQFDHATLTAFMLRRGLAILDSRLSLPTTSAMQRHVKMT